jgi:hypothetical protein
MTWDSTLPAPPATLEKRLQDDFTIAAEHAAGGGVMGARKLTLVFQDGFRMGAKWKAAPAGGDGWNNSPRREVGAWAVQELFLDPADIPFRRSRAALVGRFLIVDLPPSRTSTGPEGLHGLDLAPRCVPARAGLRPERHRGMRVRVPFVTESARLPDRSPRCAQQ